METSPERVWEVLTDFAAYRQWNPFIVEGAGQAVPGSRLEPQMRLPGRRWVFAHGMVMLELDQRFPPDADLDAAWRAGVAAFQPP